MSAMIQYLLFSIENKKGALNLFEVKRVLRAVEVTPGPDMPAAFLGFINVHGDLIPVINIRRKLGLPPKESQVSDRLLIVETASHDIAFIVDEVLGLVQPLPQTMISVGKAKANNGFKYEDELVFIYDLNQLLAEEDKLWLPEAL